MLRCIQWNKTGAILLRFFCVVVWLAHEHLAVWSAGGGGGRLNLTVVAVFPFRTSMFFDLQMTGPALEIVLEGIAVTRPDINIEIIYVKIPNMENCDDLENAVAGVSSKIYYDRLNGPNPVSVWLGPGCTTAVGQLAPLAREWNLPMLDGTATATFLADKERYPTLVRFAFNMSRVMQFLRAILEYFKWTNLAVIYREGNPVWDNLVTSASRYFAPFNRTVSLVSLPMRKNLTNDEGQVDILTRLKSSARVAVIYANGQFVRQLLGKAHNRGMANGDYVYFMVNFFKSKSFGYPLRSLGDGNDEAANKSMRSLFQFAMNQRSDEFAGFQERVYAKALTLYNYSFIPDEEVNVHIVGYCDALKVYADVIQQILDTANLTDLETSGLLLDGSSIARMMRNRTYHSVAGLKRLNANGDIDGNFLIKNYNRSLDAFEAAIEYNQGDEYIRILKDMSVDWSVGSPWPPANAPLCGYMNDNPSCFASDFGRMRSAMAACVIIALFVFCVIVGWFAKRRMRQETGVPITWWLLHSSVATTTAHGLKSFSSGARCQMLLT